MQKLIYPKIMIQKTDESRSYDASKDTPKDYEVTGDLPNDYNETTAKTRRLR